MDVFAHIALKLGYHAYTLSFMLFSTHAAVCYFFSPAAVYFDGFVKVAVICRLLPCIACWLTSFSLQGGRARRA